VIHCGSVLGVGAWCFVMVDPRDFSISGVFLITGHGVLMAEDGFCAW
jgi:hypothetical protein